MYLRQTGRLEGARHVDDDVVEARVAVHGGDGEDFDGARLVRLGGQKERGGVVQTGVGVDDEASACHGAGRPLPEPVSRRRLHNNLVIDCRLGLGIDS